MQISGDTPEMSWHERRIVFTLVHGTWGRGIFPKHRAEVRKPRWFEEGSKFYNELAKKVNLNAGHTTIESFEWSGENSFSERELAARQLAKTLTSQAERDANATRIVIAHSHGGNVALRSLAHLTCTEDLLFATIACPFVEIAPSANYASTRHAVFAGVTSIIVFYCMAISLSAEVFGVAGLIFILLAACYLFVIFYNSKNPELDYYTPPAKGRRRGASINFIGKKLKYLTEISSHDHFYNSRTPLLVIRGVYDEASLVLAAGLIATSLNRAIEWLIFKKYSRIVVPIALSTGPLSLLSSQYLQGRIDLIVGAIALFIIITALFFLAIMWVSILFTIIAKSVHGRELFFSFIDEEINTNSSPDSEVGVMTTTLFTDFDAQKSLSERSGLRHSLYDHDECVESIILWLRSHGISFANEN